MNFINKINKLFIIGFLAILFTSCTSDQPLVESNQSLDDKAVNNSNLIVEVYTTGLDVPWDIEFIDENKALVTQRPGFISLIENGEVTNREFYRVDEVLNYGEAGLMGMALHPNFPNEPYIYIMYTYEINDEPYNKVVRLKYLNDSMMFDKTIIDNILGARYHDGGRIEFGPDNQLYITTGDAGNPDLSQDVNSLNGKILRLNDDGTIPEDNPYENEIYSLGHRNPQGLTWDENGVMFSSEHGPSGDLGKRAHDEVNIIESGKNYGWPKVIGRSENENYINPLVLWADAAVPPAGMDFYKGSLYVSSLRSKTLIKIDLDKNNNVVSVSRLFEDEYGRLRDVKTYGDYMYVLTSNRDGRGNTKEGDDKILKISLKG